MSKKSQRSFLSIYLDPPVLAVALLGFASGLPLALTASTLTVWLAESGVDKAAIGLFAAIGTPYALKFLWSPLIDQLPIPVLTKMFGRRRAWIFMTQALLIVALLGLGAMDPKLHAGEVALWALLVAIASASQDIVIDAYRVELLPPEKQGPGAAAVQFGYRIGMLVSGAGALVIAQYHGWFSAYAAMSALLLVGTATVLWAGEPGTHRKKEKFTGVGAWLAKAVVHPFSDFMRLELWWLILLFVILFKLGDALAMMMTNPFLIELGFTKTEIAAVVKTFGLVATLAGVFIGGAMVVRLGMLKSLMWCAVAQMASIVMFIVQARVGHDTLMLAFTNSVENLAAGMGSAAFVAYISSLCNVSYTATQYALLSSLAVVGRTLFASFSGFVVNAVGWEIFFVVSMGACLPGIFLLWVLFKQLGNDGKRYQRKKKT